MSLFPDLLDLLRAFDEAAVEYLLIGGHVVDRATLRGRPRDLEDARYLTDAEEVTQG